MNCPRWQYLRYQYNNNQNRIQIVNKHQRKTYVQKETRRRTRVTHRERMRLSFVMECARTGHLMNINNSKRSTFARLRCVVHAQAQALVEASGGAAGRERHAVAPPRLEPTPRAHVTPTEHTTVTSHVTHHTRLPNVRTTAAELTIIICTYTTELKTRFIDKNNISRIMSTISDNSVW